MQNAIWQHFGNGIRTVFDKCFYIHDCIELVCGVYTWSFYLICESRSERLYTIYHLAKWTTPCEYNQFVLCQLTLLLRLLLLLFCVCVLSFCVYVLLFLGIHVCCFACLLSSFNNTKSSLANSLSLAIKGQRKL